MLCSQLFQKQSWVLKLIEINSDRLRLFHEVIEVSLANRLNWHLFAAKHLGKFAVSVMHQGQELIEAVHDVSYYLIAFGVLDLDLSRINAVAVHFKQHASSWLGSFKELVAEELEKWNQLLLVGCKVHVLWMLVFVGLDNILVNYVEQEVVLGNGHHERMSLELDVDLGVLHQLAQLAQPGLDILMVIDIQRQIRLLRPVDVAAEFGSVLVQQLELRQLFVRVQFIL